MSKKTSWVENFFDLLFPLYKADLDRDKAKEILDQHKPSKLYKYRKADARGFEVLEKSTLWLASADTVNDEFDCFYSYEIEEVLDSQERGFRALAPDVSDEVVRTVKNMNRDKVKNYHDELKKYFQRCMKLCSLSERADIKKMWELYAEDFTGFCIEFDFQVAPPPLWEILLPVLYSNSRIDFTAYISAVQEIKRNVNSSYIRRAALTKSPNWEYEEEWRLIIPGHPDKPGEVYSELAISGVYLGCKASQQTIDNVESICSSKRIPIKTMTMSGDIPLKPSFS